MSRRLSLLLAFVLLLLFRETTQAQERLQRLNVSNSTLAASRVPLWIARDMRLFQKYSLDANIVYIQGDVTSFQALLSGETQIAVAGSQAVVAAAGRGAPVAIVSNFTLVLNQLVSVSSIVSVKDLRGKIIGSTRPATSTDFILNRLLNRLGLVPGRDVKVLYTGLFTGNERLQVMLQGRVDATLAEPEPISQLQQSGEKLNILADAQDFGILNTSDINTTREVLKTHRPQVKAFLKAIIEATWLARTDRELTYRVLRQYFKMDPKFLDSTYKNYILKIYLDKPYPVKETIEAAIEDLTSTIPQLKGKSASDFMDTSLLREIEAEGFFDQFRR